MKNLCRLFCVIALLSFCCQSSWAQTRISRRIDGDGAFHLKELQSILTSKNDTVTVLTVLPTNLRAEDYRGVELEEGDEILMLNAKRVKSVQEFEKMYNALQISEIVKLGIRRNGQLLIESFAKIDPEKLPKGQNIVIRTGTGDDRQAEDTSGPGVTRRVVFEGEPGARPLFGTGLILKSEGDTIKIVRIIRHMAAALGETDIREGDIIVSLNGEEIRDLDRFFEIYEKLETNTKVEIGYVRDGKSQTLSFQKPEARGRVIIQQN